MLEPKPAEPKLWKALLFVALFTSVIAWFSQPLLRWPPLAWYIVLPVVILGGGWMLHQMVKDDWRSRYEMNLQSFEKGRAVRRNFRIKK